MKFDLHLNINYSAPYHITLAKFDTEYLYGILSHVMYCRITKQQCVECVQSNNVILPWLGSWNLDNMMWQWLSLVLYPLLAMIDGMSDEWKIDESCRSIRFQYNIKV